MIKVTANGTLFIDLVWFYFYSGHGRFRLFLRIWKTHLTFESWPNSVAFFRLELTAYRRIDDD